MTQEKVIDDSIGEMSRKETKIESMVLKLKSAFMGLVLVQLALATGFFVIIYYEHVDGFESKWFFYFVSLGQVIIYVLVELFGLHSAHLLNWDRLRIYQWM